MSYKAIIFDCFGVLVGSGIWKNFEAAGGDLSKYSEVFNELVVRRNKGEFDDYGFAEAVAEQCGIDKDHFLEIEAADQVPNEEVFDYIRNELKPKYKIGMISNVAHGTIERLLAPEHLEAFDSVILSADVGVQKPDRRIFEMSLKELGANADEVIFTDDQPKYLEGSKALGIESIHFSDFHQFKTELEELISLL